MHAVFLQTKYQVLKTLHFVNDPNSSDLISASQIPCMVKLIPILKTNLGFPDFK